MVWEKSPHPKTKTPARYPRNDGGSSRREPRRLVSFNCGCGCSLRTSTMIERPARIPGMADSQKTRLKHCSPGALSDEADDRQRRQRAGDCPGCVSGLVEAEPPAAQKRESNRSTAHHEAAIEVPSPPSPACARKCPGPPREQSIEPCGHSR